MRSEGKIYRHLNDFNKLSFCAKMKNLLKIFVPMLIILFFSIHAQSGFSDKTQLSEKHNVVKVKHGYQSQFKESVNFKNSFSNNLISKIRDKSLRFKPYPLLIFILVIFSLLFIKITNPDFYRELYSHLVNSKLLITSFPLKKISLRLSNLLIDFAKLFVLSLLFFDMLNDYFSISFREIFLIITAYSFLRIVLIFVFYNIFFDKGSVNIHLSNIFIFNRLMFLVILPFVFFTIFSFPPYTLIFQWFSFALLILFVFLRTQRIFIQIKMAKNYTFFYIFLYICVFEISPYFILIKEFSQII
jgi:hypothetical protein